MNRLRLQAWKSNSSNPRQDNQVRVVTSLVISEQSVLRGNLQDTRATLEAIDPIAFQPSRLISSIGCRPEIQAAKGSFVMFVAFVVPMGAGNERATRDDGMGAVRNGAMVKRDCAWIRCI